MRGFLPDAVADAVERPLAGAGNERYRPRRHLLVDRPGFFRGGNAHRTFDVGEPSKGIASDIAGVDLFHRLEDWLQQRGFDFGCAAQPYPAILQWGEAVVDVG